MSSVLVAVAALAGVPTLVGADAPSQPQTTGSYLSQLDCGSDPVVVVHEDGAYVPPRGDGPAARGSDSQALDEFLRQERVPIAAADFRRAGASAGATQFVHARDGRRVATAYVAAIGDAWHVPTFAACSSSVSPGGRGAGR